MEESRAARAWAQGEEHEIARAVAYCGLICALCQPEAACSCKGGNHCGKRLSPEGCYQYRCCREKGYAGCWECPDAPCGRDMLAPGHVKTRAFVAYIQRHGLAAFAQALARGTEEGLVYHREGIHGDWDLPSEPDVLGLLEGGEEEPDGGIK